MSKDNLFIYNNEDPNCLRLLKIMNEYKLTIYFKMHHLSKEKIKERRQIVPTIYLVGQDEGHSGSNAFKIIDTMVEGQKSKDFQKKMSSNNSHKNNAGLYWKFHNNNFNNAPEKKKFNTLEFTSQEMGSISDIYTFVDKNKDNFPQNFVGIVKDKHGVETYDSVKITAGPEKKDTDALKKNVTDSKMKDLKESRKIQEAQMKKNSDDLNKKRIQLSKAGKSNSLNTHIEKGLSSNNPRSKY